MTASSILEVLYRIFLETVNGFLHRDFQGEKGGTGIAGCWESCTYIGSPLGFPVEMAGYPGEKAGAEDGEGDVENPDVAKFDVHSRRFGNLQQNNEA